MRDRHGRGRGEALGVGAGEQQRRLVAVEPARPFQLVRIDGDVARQGLRVHADHHRHRERPGLAGEIAHRAGMDAGLLHGLAPHRLLEGLAGFDEAGETGPHARREAGGAAEQALVAVDGEHDHHRVGARKMLRAAIRAFAPPAGLGDDEALAAIGAEAAPGVPGDHRLGGGELADLLGAHQLLHGDGAQVGDEEVRPLRQHRERRRVQRQHEMRHRAVEPQQAGLAGTAAEGRRLLEREQRPEGARPLRQARPTLQHDALAGDEAGAGARIGEQGRDLAAPEAAAVEPRADIAEMGPFPQQRRLHHAPPSAARSRATRSMACGAA